MPLTLTPSSIDDCIDDWLGTSHADCWSFVRAFYLAEFAIDLPQLPWLGRARLLRTIAPSNGDIALLAMNGIRWHLPFAHVGIVMDGGILHHTAAHGVVFQTDITDAKFYRCTDREPV